MKKIQYVLLSMAAIVAACTPKDEVRIYEHTAAQDAAGVYEGTWTSVSSLSGKETLYKGTIEFQVFKDTLANQSFIYVRSEEAKWNLRGLTNVAHAGDDIVFNNDKSGSNGIEAQFYGRLSSDGKATMYFSSFGEEGIKTVIFNNSFVGKKKEQS